ncbi:CHCH domain-containing protein [Botrytis cinerea]
MSNQPENNPPVATVVQDDDEPDEWDKRIFSTGCAGKSRILNQSTIEKGEANAESPAEENSKMTDCYFEKKDWRLCKAELDTFKKCWKKHQNDQRTSTKDA